MILGLFDFKGEIRSALSTAVIIDYHGGCICWSAESELKRGRDAVSIRIQEFIVLTKIDKENVDVDKVVAQ